VRGFVGNGQERKDNQGNDVESSAGFLINQVGKINVGVRADTDTRSQPFELSSKRFSYLWKQPD